MIIILAENPSSEDACPCERNSKFFSEDTHKCSNSGLFAKCTVRLLKALLTGFKQ